MRSARAWLRRLFGVFGGDRPDRELAAELESHLQRHSVIWLVVSQCAGVVTMV